MSVAENLKRIKDEIARARQRQVKDGGEVCIVAVSKYHTIDEMHTAYGCGVRTFGENRVQELIPKWEVFQQSEAVFHLLGHLQTNKVRQVVDKVSLIQSLDSMKLAREINKRAAAIDRTLDVLVQVNMACEAQKSGMPAEEVEDFLQDLAPLTHLRVQGLMFIAPNAENKEEVRPYFKQMRILFEDMQNKSMPHVQMKWLSMGMSGDYVIAVEEGANMVRIGSALFS